MATGMAPGRMGAAERVAAPVHRLVERVQAHRSAVQATMAGGLDQLTSLADAPEAPDTLLEGSVRVVPASGAIDLRDPSGGCSATSTALP